MFDRKEATRELRLRPEEEQARSLADVPDDIQRLWVTEKTRALERLPSLSQLRFLNASEIREAQFQQICAASQITHLSANIYGIKSIRSLQNLVNLQVLKLTDDTKLTSLEGLEALTKLQLLYILNCPVTVDLAPLATCKELRYLGLENNYAKPMRLKSLSPLSGLTQLEGLCFTNIRVEDRSLAALHKLANLVDVTLPNFFSHKEFLALADALPHATGRWLDLHKQNKHKPFRKPAPPSDEKAR